MEAVSITINKEDCDKLAQRLFFEMSGINKDGDKYVRMRADAGRMRQLAEDRIAIKLKCNYYDDVQLSGDNAVIGGESFVCKAFEQIDRSHIKGAYVYALTAGDFDIEEEAITNRLYLDIWGTAFTDAARELLEAELIKRDRLSDEFGPGFYGMPTGEMSRIDKLMKFEDIGVRYVNQRILSPVKSCCGIFFSVNDEYKRLNNECQDCVSHDKSCVLCRTKDT